MTRFLECGVKLVLVDAYRNRDYELHFYPFGWRLFWAIYEDWGCIAVGPFRFGCTWR